MTLVCDSCGFVNKPGSTVCEKCGQSLSVQKIIGINPNIEGTTDNNHDKFSRNSKKNFSSFSSSNPAVKRRLQKRHNELIERASLGILFFAIGLAILWIPYIQFLGELLVLVGFILIFLAREVHNREHTRNVKISLVIFIITFIAGFAIAAYFLSSVLAAVGRGDSPSTISKVFQSSFYITIIGAMVLGAFSGVAYVLLTLELQDTFGKELLIIGYILLIVVAIVEYFMLAPLLHSFVAEIANYPNSALSAERTISSRETAYGLLNAIPYLVLSGAYFRTRSRLLSGEI